MRTIKQKDGSDCGVACVAMLTGAPYDEVRSAVYPSDRSKLTHTKDLHAALLKFGRKPLTERRMPFGAKTPADIGHDALIFVKMGKKGDGKGHWIVWDAKAGKLRNPDQPEKPYRMRGYMAVE